MGQIKKNYQSLGLLFLVIINVAIWTAVFYERPKDYVSVSFLDVGQGDSLLITGRTGNQIIIDAGPSKSILRQISKEISFFDKFVDVLVATHPDKDHIAGFPHLINRYRVGVFIEPGAESPNSFDDEIDRLLTEKDVKTLIAHKGMIVDLMDGSYLEILFPDRDVSSLNTNDASIIARYVYGDTCFMLTGDAPEKMENYIVSILGNSLNCEVLKVGHHGSKTSTSDIFLSAVSPKYGVISAGKDNSYGHPHIDVVERLKNFDVKIFETAKEGNITFHSDGTNIKVK